MQRFPSLKDEEEAPLTALKVPETTGPTPLNSREVDDFVSIHPDLRSIPKSDHDPRLVEIMRRRGILNSPSLRVHAHRYLHSARHIPSGKWLRGGDYEAALEIGTTGFFPLVLRDILGFPRVDFTDFKRSGEPVEVVALPGDWTTRDWVSLHANVEEEPLPVPNKTYDLVLCFEVIEHLEKDPMYMMAEINRVLKPGGLLFLTTPNCISARNVIKILKGYAPHFFMKYGRGATLYRHNIEYAPNQITSIFKAAGFQVRRLWTEDLFEAPVPEAISLLEEHGFTTRLRGDNLLIIGEKTTDVQNRFPPEIYFG